MVFDRAPGEAFLRLPGQIHRLEDAITLSGARYVVLDPILSFLDRSVNVGLIRACVPPFAPLADSRPIVTAVRSRWFVTSIRAVARTLCIAAFIRSASSPVAD